MTAAERILVLGGTSFLGRAIVERALSDGHEVTLFNRGVTNPGLYPEAEHLKGDRSSDLSALEGRAFDLVIDVACYDPADAARSVSCLKDSTGRYVFVSTVSVYERHDTVEAQKEDAPVLPVRPDQDAGERYGANKAAAEEIVRDAFGDGALIGRPGLIVGPYDKTDRFTYWPRRLAHGGRVLAPESPDYVVQFIDVRDLGSFLLRAGVGGLSGTFNLVGPPMSLGGLLESCRVPEVPAELVYVPGSALVAAGVEQWMGLPLWIAEEGWEAANTVDGSAAVAAGLSFRPLRETVEGARSTDPGPGPHTLRIEREAELLKELAPES